ncbi:histidinol-phosphatase HisJ family protein [Candidatus Soleaferrea massiliensis]|uniref:histidinol-phosphatase HisJ family protein n=1 Tax=Candidatus Soleaferrea massiliensis TaxID=1470354 RepID=UPI0005907660|nr:histidinol-phosphatase HisJ family protein [Candidatus Soleaferrea massiliensis]
MEFCNIFDSHTHSDNSPDGTSSIIYMCENAIKYGISGISMTDHCEVNAFYKDRYDKSIAQSFFETRKAKAAFGKQLEITNGIEIGQPLQAVKNAETALESNPYDFVLASVHNLTDEEDFYYLNYAELTLEEVYSLLERYFIEVLDTAKWNRFDSLAHLTYPLRYIHEAGITVELSRFDDLIDEIFKTLIQNGKALELNTSGLRQPIGQTLPSPALVRRYRELGGELITIGSDAHRHTDLGAGISDGMGIAKEAGFQYFAFYKQHSPKMLTMI